MVRHPLASKRLYWVTQERHERKVPQQNLWVDETTDRRESGLLAEVLSAMVG